MPLVLLERLDRGDRSLDPLQSRARVDEPQIVRRERREQGHPDIRRRRTVGHHAGRLLLDVVRREPVHGVVHRRLEILPGGPRHLPEVLAVAQIQDDRARKRGPAQPERDERRDEPEKKERKRGRDGGRARRQGGGQERQGHRGARPHSVGKGAQALADGQSGRSGRGGGGGLPFEQHPLREDQPHQREPDRVSHLVGVVRQQGELEQHLRGRRGDLLAQISQEHAPGLMLRRTHQTAPELGQDREAHGPDHRQGPGPGRPGEPGPG